VTTDATLLNVALVVETGSGRRGQGFGSMPMGNSWAWPTANVSLEQTKDAMVVVGRHVAQEAGEYLGSGHPLDITRDLAVRYGALAEEVVRAGGLAESMPRLAQLVAASPTEAAIHDAFGKALGENSYNLLGPEFVHRDLSEYLGPEFAGEYLDRYTLRQPKARMPLYHLVGALDPLTDADIAQRINDGLPETLPEWIAADGLTHLKIKLNGDDLAWDVEWRPRHRPPAAARNGAIRPISTRSAPTWNTCLIFWPASASNRRWRSSGFSTSSSRPTATCVPTARTACTRRPSSSPW
jgi:hypothetical protein